MTHTGFQQWISHIGQSHYCFMRYGCILDSHGREACPCGWVSQPPQPISMDEEAYIPIVGEKCYSCHQYRITVDETGYCRTCRQEDEDRIRDILDSPNPYR